MKNRFRHFRVSAGLTQARAAQAAGVTQPTYQRWETGQVEIPSDKLKKLAKAFETTEAELRGDPIRVSLYDSKANPEHNYYGEVAVHFRGGGDPILLSVSDAACDKLHHELQQDLSYLTIESLANQTVILRRDAISDLYFSSEAYDDYGPEHRNKDGSFNRGGYKNHYEFQIADPLDWDIINALATDGVGLEDFAETDIERVQKAYFTSDEEFAQLITDGHLKPEDLEAAKAAESKQCERLFEAATKGIYQLSNGGVQRKWYCHDDGMDLYNSVWELIECEAYGDEMLPEMIRFSPEGSHRMFFINRVGFDYISLPSHILKRSWLDAREEEIDSFDPEVQVATKLAVSNNPSRKKPRRRKTRI